MWTTAVDGSELSISVRSIENVKVVVSSPEIGPKCGLNRTEGSSTGMTVTGITRRTGSLTPSEADTVTLNEPNAFSGGVMLNLLSARTSAVRGPLDTTENERGSPSGSTKTEVRSKDESWVSSYIDI